MGRTKSREKEVAPMWGGKQVISTGSTMLNLALSDTRLGGCLAGTAVNIVGTKHAGKSIQAFTMGAEVCSRIDMKDWRIKFYNPENGIFFDIRRLFGSALEDRLDLRGIRCYDEFQEKLDDDLDEADGAPSMYILDSFDAIASAEQRTLAAKRKKAKSAEAKAKVAGSYQLENTRKLTTHLPLVMPRMEDSGSLFVIISQVRQNLDAMSKAKYRRNGGEALGHWCSTEFWIHHLKREEKTVKGIKREIGNRVRVKVKKTRLTGKKREAEYSIYPEYGIDDIGSCVDFLIETDVFEKLTDTTWSATGFRVKGQRMTIIKHIENDDMVEQLQDACEKKWNQIEESMKMGRKPRFA